MAARDRFGGLGAGASQLTRLIQRACDPGHYEPDLAMDLDIADMINQKKGSAPREAAVAIVGHINQRNPNVSLLALTLLDICVKNCGYPFHLQISTKEFLNELVRRFPERPPMRPSRVQTKILEAIEEWRQTICQTSRHKDDLGFIRDMHRLLAYKGYTFPEVKREDASVLNPSDNLKSAEEMEEEEKSAQSAKLQELIRRGGPEDLQEANRLMKVMAGYDTRNKTDYRAKAAEEVGKIQQKAKILEEMLQGYKQGDKMAEGDVFEELANALQSAQPKIQKMCEEESDDQEAVAKLFEINDSIHRTIERYKLVKKGDIDGAAKIPKGTLGTSTGVGKTADHELSLIDFGGELDSGSNGTSNGMVQTGQAPSQGSGSVEDDLLGLSLNDSTYGQSGGIALGFGANSNLPGPALLSSTSQLNSARTSSPGLAAQPQGPQPVKPDYSAFSSMTGSRPPSQSMAPGPSSIQQQKPQAPSQASSLAATDPFSAFSSPALRQGSPFQLTPSATQAPYVPSPSFYTGNPQSQGSSLQSSAARHSNGATNDNEEWTFSSALPESTALPTANEMIVSNSSVNIRLSITRQANVESSITMLARFSNNTAQMVSELTFQVAVTKGYTLKMEPQSGRTLTPNVRDGISQQIHLYGVERGKSSGVKMRWKASYLVGSHKMDEQGEIPALGVS